MVGCLLCLFLASHWFGMLSVVVILPYNTHLFDFVLPLFCFVSVDSNNLVNSYDHIKAIKLTILFLGILVQTFLSHTHRTRGSNLPSLLIST